MRQEDEIGSDNGVAASTPVPPPHALATAQSLALAQQEH